MEGFAIAREADTARVVLDGKPDREALRACAADLAREIDAGVRHLEFDLSGLRGLDVSAAALMARAAASVRKSAGSVAVRGAQGAVSEAIRILGLGAGG